MRYVYDFSTYAEGGRCLYRVAIATAVASDRPNLIVCDKGGVVAADVADLVAAKRKIRVDPTAAANLEIQFAEITLRGLQRKERLTKIVAAQRIGSAEAPHQRSVCAHQIVDLPKRQRQSGGQLIGGRAPWNC